MQRWTVHLEGGPRRVNHAAVSVEDRIYSFGGYCTGEDYDTTRPMDVHVLHTVSLRWKLLPLATEHDPEYDNIPYQRYGHSAVAYEDSAYIWGGRNDSDGACNTLFQYDTAKKKWFIVQTKGARPGARDGHSACVIDKKMYIFGGYEEELDRFSDDIHTYSFETNVWEFVHTKGVPARWRDFHTAIGIGSVMYVFGGRSDLGGEIFTNNEMYCNKLNTFDTVSRTWHEPVTTGRSPTGRRSHSVFVYDNCMYIFGGYNGEREMHFKDIYKFDPAKNRWSLVKVKGEGPCARRRQCCCRIDTKVFLFGGTSPTAPGDNQTEQEGNLMDHSDLHVLDLAPSLKTLAQLAVIENKLDTSCLPRDLRKCAEQKLHSLSYADGDMDSQCQQDQHKSQYVPHIICDSGLGAKMSVLFACLIKRVVSFKKTFKAPTFPPELWSVYDRTLADEPRTNNQLEGWHRRFKVIVDKHHPNIYQFMDRLKGEQAHTETTIEQLIGGMVPQAMRKKVQKMNEKIKRICQDHAQRTVQEYLKGIAYNINY